MANTSSTPPATAPSLPSEHFLNLPRPDIVIGGGDGVVDTTTLAAHDFDVDTRTGFMPPDPPIARLPKQWEPWEAVLEHATKQKLQLAIRRDLSVEDAEKSAAWRAQVREVSASRIPPFAGCSRSVSVYPAAHTCYARARLVRSVLATRAPRPHLYYAFLHTHAPPDRARPHSRTHLHPTPPRLETPAITPHRDLLRHRAV